MKIGEVLKIKTTILRFSKDLAHDIGISLAIFLK